VLRVPEGERGMRLDEWRAEYAALGFATIPLVPCGKRPLRKGWLDGRESQWEGAPARANIGILTGARSGGLVVLDFDTRDGPERVLGMTPQQLAIVTIVVETSRGWHVYARGDDVASGTPLEGLDVRGEGGMVVAPPSVHPSGGVYAFVGTCRSVVSLDAIAPMLSMRSPEPSAPIDALQEAESWIGLQAPKLQEAWRRLKEPPSGSFDASRADFAIARCLWEGGWSREDAVVVLLALPGSRARERGEPYAALTVARAFAVRGGRV